MQETELFSSRCLRRSMPTLAEMRETHPDDADALGDWTASKDSKMRVRYADSSEERAVLVKTEHMLVVRRMIGFKVALDWRTCRLLLANVDKAAISVQANDMLAVDSTSEETPKRLPKDLVKPKRRFNIAAITAHIRARKTQHQQLPETVQGIGQQPAHEPVLPMTVHGASRRWVMVKFQGAPRVHLLPEDSETPLRRRRRGSAGKPLVRLEGSGTGIAYWNSMSWGISCVCTICV